MDIGESAGRLPKGGADVQSLEKGILALLSFLGHSYNKGVITDELYKQEKDSALRRLDELRKLEQAGKGFRINTEEEAEDFEIEEKKQKMQKNKADVESLLSFLEDSYNEGSISESGYRELKRENLKKLSRINRLLGRDGLEGEQVELESPEDIFEKFSKLPERETEGREEGEQFEPGAEAEPENLNAEYAETPAPQLDLEAEPRVKPISFKDRLERFAERGEQIAEKDESDDIMRALNVIQKKRAPMEPSPDLQTFSAAPAAIQSEVKHKAAALLGKLSGIIGKGRQQQQQVQASTAAPGLPDKLPEEMTPEELAAAEKAKEQAAVQDVQSESATQQAYSGESAGSEDISKLILEVEKLKVKIEGVGETRSVLEERIEHIMESIGELRTMLFEKESGAKEQEAKLDKFVEMVSDLEPQRFAKELDKRDRQLSEHELKVEKLEAMMGDVAQNVNKIRGTLDAIGSLKNIATVSKDIADRSSKIDSTVSKVERLADETGRAYVELSRRMNEFSIYKGKQDILAEALKELVAMTESLSSKLDTFATKDDIGSMKRELEDSKLMAEELQSKIELLSEGGDLPEHINDLQEEKEGFEQILESNEEEFLEGRIKEPEYKKMKELHTKKLQMVRLKLKGELTKFRQERLQEMRKATDVQKSVENAVEKQTATEKIEEEGSEEQAEAETEEVPAEEKEQEVKKPAERPKKSIKKAEEKAPEKFGEGKTAKAVKPQKQTIIKTISEPAPVPMTKSAQPQMKFPSRIPTSSAVEDEEMEGEVDEEKLQEAEEVAKLQDEEQEAEEESEPENEGDGESDIEADSEPAEAMGQKPPRAKVDGMKKSPSSKRFPTAKLSATEPALSLKMEKPLSAGGWRIYDVIKKAPEGRRVSVQAMAMTVKKDESKCLVKLEDESGVIYGVSASPLKGQLLIVGTVAKDAKGVPYMQIIKAK